MSTLIWVVIIFGAYFEISARGSAICGGGKEGLLHISKISSKRVEKVEDVLAIGDEIRVKVSEIDSQGRVNLTMKDLESTAQNKDENKEEK